MSFRPCGQIVRYSKRQNARNMRYYPNKALLSNYLNVKFRQMLHQSILKHLLATLQRFLLSYLQIQYQKVQYP